MGKMPRIIKTGPPAKRPGGLVPTQRAGRRYETWLWHGEGERARKKSQDIPFPDGLLHRAIEVLAVLTCSFQNDHPSHQFMGDRSREIHRFCGSESIVGRGLAPRSELYTAVDPPTVRFASGLHLQFSPIRVQEPILHELR